MKSNPACGSNKRVLLLPVFAASLLAAVTGQGQNHLVWAGTNNAWNLTAFNWLLGAQHTNFAQGDHVTFDATAAIFNPSLGTTLSPGSVIVNGSSNYTFAGSGKLSEATGITKNGTGTLLVNNANDFTGQVLINEGTLRAGNTAALGTSAGNTVVAAGATLDIGGQNLTTEPVVIQGGGLNGVGAINNSGGQQQNALRFLTLTGDTTFGASANRWDISNSNTPGGSFAGNGHTLTKVGPQAILIRDVGETGLGDIHVVAGRLGFQGFVTAGDPARTLTVESNAILTIFINGGFPENIDKKLVLNGGAAVDSGGAANHLLGTVTLNGTSTFGTRTDLHLWNTISGTGGFIHTVTGPVGNGNGSLYLYGTNTYSGPTIIRANSRVVLGENSSLGTSSPIQLDNGGMLDASALPAVQLVAGQIMMGFGSVLGNVSAGSGSVLSPGNDLQAGTLNLNGNAALTNATLKVKLSGDPFSIGGGVNDLLSIAGSIDLGGVSTIHVVPVGVLDLSAPYTVAQYGGVLNGNAASLTAVSANARYSVSVIDPATTYPYIQVAISGNPGALVWRGGKAPHPTAWDHSTTNWFNGDTGGFDVFYNGDATIFDDTAATNRVEIVGTNQSSRIVMANHTMAFTFEGDGSLIGPLQLDGTGNLTLALSNTPTLSSISNNAGTLIFALGDGTHTIAANITDDGSGMGTIAQNGANTLVLRGANNFFGTVQVNNGILRAGALSALGFGPGVAVVADGATLDINGRNLSAKPVVVQGNGFNGEGAINNTGGQNQTALAHVTLAGDATFNAPVARWDINGASGGSFTGNGHTLTKTGSQAVLIRDVGETGLGHIDVTGGRLGFQGNVTLGDPSKTLTVSTNAIVTFFFSGFGPENLDKHLILHDTAAIDSGGGANNFLGPVTLSGTSTFGTRADLHLWNAVTGSGGFIATVTGPVGNGTGALHLHGTNSYSGPTIIRPNSRVVVGENSSLGASALIQLDDNSTLDVSARSVFTLNAGQTLFGNGTVVAGELRLGSGSILAPGPAGTLGTLTVWGNLDLQSGSTHVFDLNPSETTSDSIVGATSVNFGGTLVLQNLSGAPYTAGSSFTLFSAGAYSGAFEAIVPAMPGPGLRWNTAELAVSGTLGIIAGPQFTQISAVGGNVQLSGSGAAHGSYQILTSPDISLPLAQWTVLTSGTFDDNGQFTHSDPAGPNAKFYLLVTP